MRYRSRVATGIQKATSVTRASAMGGENWTISFTDGVMGSSARLTSRKIRIFEALSSRYPHWQLTGVPCLSQRWTVGRRRRTTEGLPHV